MRFLLLLLLTGLSSAQPLTLQQLVAPPTTVTRDDKPVPFALYGLVEFNSLNDTFAYIDTQAGRWQFPNAQARQQFADGLLRRAVESRIVSMATEEPLEILLTHTPAAIDAAIARLPDPIYAGRNWTLSRAAYAAAFQRVRARWSTSLNCWSASPVIAGRVLSNWYVIEEGIGLYGARYDSVEHFWQATKYHPDVAVADLLSLLDDLDRADLAAWLARLDGDQRVYLAHSYIVEFLRANLAPAKRAWFRAQLQALVAPSNVRAAKTRELQQRSAGSLRFTSLQEKIFWGDLADVFHLLAFLDRIAPIDSRLRASLARLHFDAVYVGSRKLGFVSPEFRALMLEVWKIKFLKMPRFRDVIVSIPPETKLDHFLNDGDSPDIPIPIYVGYLNEIRRLARTH